MGNLEVLFGGRGRITFAEFMAVALYHPDIGYYTRPRAGPGPAGRKGDFLTAPTASPLFARTFARMLVRLSESCGEPLLLVELGAGEGAFLRGLLEALGPKRDVLRRIVAVESGRWAQQRLEELGPTIEVRSELGGAERAWGPLVLFASELYDAFPVHRVTMVQEQSELRLREFYVEQSAGGKLGWVLDEPSTPEIEVYLQEHGVRLAEGQIVELRPGVRRFHAQTLHWCGDDGVALILDYGHAGHRLYDPRARKLGTLVGYRDHQVVTDVLADPGEVDITAHLNFDDLEQAASDAGWELAGLTPMGMFLTLHGAVGLLAGAVSSEGVVTAEDWAELAAAKRVLMPSGMGTDLKVQSQGKGRIWEMYRRLITPPPGEA